MMAAGEAGRLAGDIARSSTDSGEVAQANRVIPQAESTVIASRQAQEQAINNGATSVDWASLALGGTDTPDTTPEEISDTEPASPI
jgi:hypothetical protein